MKPSDALRAAREKISTPEKWTQGAYARDAGGNAVRAAADDAVCWCALGAIVSLNIFPADREEAAGALYKVVPEVSVFNDKPGRTHAEVMAVFAKAIERAEASVQ